MTMHHPIITVLIMLCTYAIGSINSAILISRVCHLPNPRESGSKNPGATNILRLAGKKYALIVLIFDIVKGFLPVFIANLCGADNLLLSMMCLAVILGHIFPVFFGFHGGKGIATALGALLGLDFMLGFICIMTWLLTAQLTRYSSLASIISVALAPFYALFLIKDGGTFAVLFIIALMTIYKHHDNINRLLDGTEPKIKSNKLDKPGQS
jgi:glycerol-3-phosphate acyltransferase PlsY